VANKGRSRWGWGGSGYDMESMIVDHSGYRVWKVYAINFFVDFEKE